MCKLYKLFLVYALITIISGIVLFLILTENLITIKKDQALEMSGQVIESVDSFLQKFVFRKICWYWRSTTVNWKRP
ncbi:hypothetical protein [uncultured Robinsoniella sp.]|uniref:hypothetical protein n=1 Tax=Robinsoniella sp. TaxID=2496533 RepID=UPI00374F390D